MAQLPQPFVCDVCGVAKGEQNHWFRVWKIIEEAGNYVAIAPWSTQPPPIKEHFHCCGEEHALRKAAELLGKLKENA